MRIQQKDWIPAQKIAGMTERVDHRNDGVSTDHKNDNLIRHPQPLAVIPEVVFGDPEKGLPTRCVLDSRLKDHGNDERVNSQHIIAICPRTLLRNPSQPYINIS